MARMMFVLPTRTLGADLLPLERAMREGLATLERSLGLDLRVDDVKATESTMGLDRETPTADRRRIDLVMVLGGEEDEFVCCLSQTQDYTFVSSMFESESDIPAEVRGRIPVQYWTLQNGPGWILTSPVAHIVVAYAFARATEGWVDPYGSACITGDYSSCAEDWLARFVNAARAPVSEDCRQWMSELRSKFGVR